MLEEAELSAAVRSGSLNYFVSLLKVALDAVVRGVKQRQPAGIVDDHIDTRSRRPHSQHRGKPHCNTFRRFEHRKGMECARISCLLGLPWKFL